MPAISQEHRKLRITTPFGTDVLVPASFTGTEELSRPFEYVVECVSESDSLDASKVLGKSVTLHLEVVDGTIRHLNGLVRRFSTLGSGRQLTLYRLEIVPSTWFLSLGRDCRTFENKTALEVVEAVCGEADVALSTRVTTTPPTREYIAQYNESNLDFISRLLDELGLYYCFEHADGSHTMVVTDAKAGSIPQLTPEATVLFRPNTEANRYQDNAIFERSHEYAVHSKKTIARDHDLLRVDSTGDASNGGSHARGEQFEFYGDLGLDRASADASLRIEEEERGYNVVRGKGTCAAFVVGTRFTLSEGPSDVDGKEFHLVSVTHRMESNDVFSGEGLQVTYENSFSCIPSSTPYRPRRVAPRPNVRGTHIAKVVGSGGDGAIDVDAEGRVLLQFPWDRGAGKDGASEHRVHVASVWGGVKWGFVQIPRIAQEVLVEYLHGDIDRPVITGRVYNSQHQYPYTLPDNKTQSGWKSQTLGGGADNFNELRFEDKQGSEHVYLQAEKDHQIKVKNDETRDVLHDRTTTVKNNDTRTVTEGDDTHTVKAGKQTNTIKGDLTTKVESGNRSTTVDSGNDTHKVSQGNMDVDVSLGNITIKAGAGSITIQAAQKIELKVGGNSITIDMQGVAIKGTNVKSEAQAMADFKGAMTTVEGSGMATLKSGGMTTVKGSITMIN